MNLLRTITPWQKLLLFLGLLLHIWVFSAAILNRSYLTDDSIQYLQIADNWANEGVYSQSYAAPFVPDLQRTPGYPLFLRMTAKNPLLILLLQHLLALLNAWLLYKTGRFLFSQSLAVWAGIGLLFMPYQFLFASLILSETLFISCLLAGTYFLFRFLKSRQLGDHLLLILFLGAAAYVRPLGLPVLGLLQLALMWKFRRKMITVLPGLGLAVLLILPWMLRNQRVADRFSFNVMGDMGLVHGRLGGLEAHRLGRSFDEIELYRGGDSLLALETGLPGTRSYYSTSQNHETELYPSAVGGVTIAYFFRHPVAAIVFQLRCLSQMLKGVAYGWGDKVMQNLWAARMFAGIQLVFNILMFAGFLFFIFVLRSWKPEHWFLFAGVVVVLFISAAAWADGRYRMVVDPWIWLLALSFFKDRLPGLSQAK